MNFNNLYISFLENIIILNKATRAQMLTNVLNHLLIEKFLNLLANKGKVQNKAADFLARFFKSGLLKDIKDNRIKQVIGIITRKNNIDIQANIKLDLFIKQNLKYADRDRAKNDLDSYPEFSLKKVYDNGVVTYRVEDSKAGQEAIRKITNAYFGDDFNGWCIVSNTEGLELNWRNRWLVYTGYPKHIAFQNGKLIGFSASYDLRNYWWDRMDVKHDKLKLLDGTWMLTDKYKFTPRLKKKILKLKKQYE